jgi:hypothetical protein
LFGALRLRMVRGATWSDTISLIDAVGDPVDLTSAIDIVMRVRSTADSSVVLLELSVANDRLSIDNAPGGIVGLLVAAEDTLGLPTANHEIEQYVFDAVIDRGGSPQVIEPAYSGYLTVYPQVTRLLTEP